MAAGRFEAFYNRLVFSSGDMLVTCYKGPFECNKIVKGGVIVVSPGDGSVTPELGVALERGRGLIPVLVQILGITVPKQLTAFEAADHREDLLDPWRVQAHSLFFVHPGDREEVVRGFDSLTGAEEMNGSVFVSHGVRYNSLLPGRLVIVVRIGRVPYCG